MRGWWSGLLSAEGSGERGAAAVMIAVSSVVLVGMAAFAVDVGQLYWVRAELQNAADSAVLAAANEIPDQGAVSAAAIQYANDNSDAPGTILAAGDVDLGFWDSETAEFVPGGSPINAVRAITRRSESNGNAVDHFFGPVLGRDQSYVKATAVALLGTSVLDFEGFTPGDQPSQISHGSGISGEPVPGYVTVTGPGYGPMIFDGTCNGGGPPQCSGGDSDLWQPAQGNILIISEDGDSSDPDDDGRGGVIEFDFSNFGNGSVTVGSLVLIDAEEGGLATLYRNGEIIDQVVLGGVSDGEMETRFISEVPGVDFMTVELEGSGAVDDIGYHHVIRLVQ